MPPRSTSTPDRSRCSTRRRSWHAARPYATSSASGDRPSVPQHVAEKGRPPRPPPSPRVTGRVRPLRASVVLSPCRVPLVLACARGFRGILRGFRGVGPWVGRDGIGSSFGGGEVYAVPVAADFAGTLIPAGSCPVVGPAANVEATRAVAFPRDAGAAPGRAVVLQAEPPCGGAVVSERGAVLLRFGAVLASHASAALGAGGGRVLDLSDAEDASAGAQAGPDRHRDLVVAHGVGQERGKGVGRREGGLDPRPVLR